MDHSGVRLVLRHLGDRVELDQRVVPAPDQEVVRGRRVVQAGQPGVAHPLGQGAYRRQGHLGFGEAVQDGQRVQPVRQVQQPQVCVLRVVVQHLQRPIDARQPGRLVAPHAGDDRQRLQRAADGEPVTGRLTDRQRTASGGLRGIDVAGRAGLHHRGERKQPGVPRLGELRIVEGLPQLGRCLRGPPGAQQRIGEDPAHVCLATAVGRPVQHRPCGGLRLSGAAEAEQHDGQRRA